MAAALRNTDEMFLMDSGYVLELNLQRVRRDLISMIEVFEHKDCSECKQLKCTCAETNQSAASTAGGSGCTGGTSSTSSTSSTGNTDSDDFSTMAPSANVLPKPMWGNTEPGTSESKTGPKDVESWVRACTLGAPPTLPEAAAGGGGGGGGGAELPRPSFKWTERADRKSSSDAAAANTSLSAILSKLPYDFKCRSWPSQCWPGAAHAMQTYHSPVHDTGAVAGTSTMPHLYSGSSRPEPAGGRGAVDAFFRSFRVPSTAAQTDVAFTSSQ